MRAPKARRLLGTRMMVFSMGMKRLASLMAGALPVAVLAILAGCSKRETSVEAGIRTQTLLFGNAVSGARRIINTVVAPIAVRECGDCPFRMVRDIADIGRKERLILLVHARRNVGPP